MELFNIDYNRLANLLLPNFLRQFKLVLLLQACYTPLKHLHGEFTKNRADNIKKVEHNGQVCYLRKILNDELDSTKRRIRIDDVSKYEAVLFERRQNSKPILFDIRTVNKKILFSLRRGIEKDEEGADFIVYYPAELTVDVQNNFREMEEKERYMRSIVNYYKLTSKKYTLQPEGN